MKILPALLLFLFSSFASAGPLDKELEKIISQLNMNTTSPGVYKGQEGVFVYGGNMYSRGKSQNVRLAGITLPGYTSSGCSFDLWTGGFDYINSEKLNESLKNIATNAASYAFSLALKSLSLQMSDTVSQLQRYSNTINSLNINSCEAARLLVDNAKDVVTAQDRMACVNQKIGQAKSGVVTAFSSCSSPKGTSDSKGEASDEDKENFSENTNIAWNAINNSSLGELSTTEKFFLMSLSGTVIVKKEANGLVYETHPPILTNDLESFVTGVSHGGDEIELYTCSSLDADNNSCINMQKRSYREIQNGRLSLLNKDKNQEGIEILGVNFYQKIFDILKSIEDKVTNDEQLSTAEQLFIAKSSLPIYKLVRLHVAYNRKINLESLHLHEFAEIIAIDKIISYIEESAAKITSALSMAPQNKSQKQTMQENSKIMLSSLASLRRLQHEKIEQRNQMLTRIDSLRRSLTEVFVAEAASQIKR